MIVLSDKHHCCGCEACVQVCPKRCISFEEDAEGFRYPSVDMSVCIDCGLCEKICPVIHQSDERTPLVAYAAKNDNVEELLKSSSGGIFILLAKEVLRQGGVVFGARFNENWEVVHDYADTEEGVKAFMGSKYVQSRIGNTFTECRTFLKQGRKVLFSGTPCQIAGLKNFLRKEYENLLTVDLICHGVPSPKVWRSYLEEIKENARQGENSVSSSPIHSVPERGTRIDRSEDEITGISFRDKRLGWKKYSFALTLAKASADGKKNTVSLSHTFTEDPYMKLFLSNLSLRPSCYACPAKSGKSQSDVTIADFWGIEKSYPDYADDNGVGLLLANSSKGIQLLESIPLWKEKVNWEEAIRSNPSYMHAVEEPSKRKFFFKKLDQGLSLQVLAANFTKIPTWLSWKYKFNTVLVRLIQSLLKK